MACVDWGNQRYSVVLTCNLHRAHGSGWAYKAVRSSSCSLSTPSLLIGRQVLQVYSHCRALAPAVPSSYMALPAEMHTVVSLTPGNSQSKYAFLVRLSHILYSKFYHPPHNHSCSVSLLNISRCMLPIYLFVRLSLIHGTNKGLCFVLLYS